VAKKKIPGPIERRHLVERELSAEQALRYAEAYLSEGLELDAIAFLAKAGATEQLAALRTRAIETGDGFLLRMVASAMDAAVTSREWQSLAEAARRSGKERYAAGAMLHVEREGS